MKKSLWTVMMGIVLLLASCQNDDDYQTLSKAQPERDGTSHFYGVKSVAGEVELRGVAQRDKLWNPGTVITVKLLSDPYGMADKIKTYAAEWEQYADIKFDFVTSGNANVRIGFDWNDNRWVTWSYTGTDCKFIRNQNEATVNFAFWDTASEVEKRADVLRAFGQVLGLELEHRHLSFDPGWTSRIPEYWQSEIEDIPWDELKEYVFDPVAERNLVQTNEYDENSIMIWPFSRKYANNTARECNYELSEMDKQFINQLYPKEREEEEQLALTLKLRGAHGKNPGLHLELYREGSYRIEYADGTNMICEGDSISIFERSRDMEGLYESVKVYGDPENIKKIRQLYNGYFYWEIVDISLCKNLIELHGDLGKVEAYDFSIYPKLESLVISGYSLENLDVERLENLKSFECYSSVQEIKVSNPGIEKLVLDITKLASLDISNLRNLKSLYLTGSRLFNGNKLGEIDVSANEMLESLTITCTYSGDLNLMNNRNLKNLSFAYVSLSSLDLSNCTHLNYIYFNDFALLSNEAKAIAFANSLPTVINGTIKLFATKSDYIQSISESKGWTVTNT